MSDISKAKFGKETVSNAYNVIVTWKKNLFQLPGNATGKAVRAEMARLCDAYTQKTDLEEISLKLLIIFGPLMLQKSSKRCKNKDNVLHLARRLEQWKRGEIDELLREGLAIQKRLLQPARRKGHVSEVFSHLMLQGNVKAALRWLSQNTSEQVPIDDAVFNTLQSKHPRQGECQDSALYQGPIELIEPVIFDGIDGSSIEKAARNMSGGAGPSGMDAECWKRILCSKSGGKARETLCDSIANVVRRLAREYVDPKCIDAVVNCRLIPLDKNPGIRPIGIGEVFRRIMGKSFSSFTRQDTLRTAGPL